MNRPDRIDVLVLGANGLLGGNLVTELRRRGERVLGGYHIDPPTFDPPAVRLDLRETEKFADVLSTHDPRVVINSAALTDVDVCENDSEVAREVNGIAPGRLARLSANHDTEFVHLSTDYVFAGINETRYDERTSPKPLQAYGRSKLLGECAVQAFHPSPLIPRVSFVYGRQGHDGRLKGFPSWMLNQLRRDKRVPLLVDQHVTPTRARQAAETILDLLTIGADGIVHVACRTCTTPYEMGHRIASALDKSTTLLSETTMAQLDRPAPRPRHSCLDTHRVESLLVRPQPTLRADLRALFRSGPSATEQ